MTVADLSSRISASELVEWRHYLEGETAEPSSVAADPGLDGDAMYQRLRAMYPGF